MKTTRYHIRNVGMWGRQDNGKEGIPQRGKDCHLEGHYLSHQLGTGEDPWWLRCGHLMHIEFYFARGVHGFIIRSQKSLLIVVGVKCIIKYNPNSEFVWLSKYFLLYSFSPSLTKYIPSQNILLFSLLLGKGSSLTRSTSHFYFSAFKLDQ